jgi:F0F1-type ATP synthase membrane subunit b/b'
MGQTPKRKIKMHTAEEEKMKIVHDAKVEAKALIDAGTSKGESVARDISLKAQHDADALRGRLSDEIKNAKDNVEEEFSKSAPAHIANILESILGKNMNPEINQDFIKSQLSIMK